MFCRHELDLLNALPRYRDYHVDHEHTTSDHHDVHDDLSGFTAGYCDNHNNPNCGCNGVGRAR